MRKLVLWSCAVSKTLENVSERKLLRKLWILSQEIKRNFEHSSSLIWPHGSAPAALASLFFDPPGPQIFGKTWWTATFLPFRAPESSFFWLLLFYDLLSSSLLFSSLTLPTSAAFPSVHIVGRLASKLPSNNFEYTYTFRYSLINSSNPYAGIHTSHT